MPGEWLPRGLHASLAAEVKSHLLSKGYRVPVAVAGKLDAPQDAERLIAEGRADMVGIARGLLADPDWPIKVRLGELDRIVQCDYCNVCKALDGTHRTVICALWPQGSIQAPKDDPSVQAPQWAQAGHRPDSNSQRIPRRTEMAQGRGGDHLPGVPRRRTGRPADDRRGEGHVLGRQRQFWGGTGTGTSCAPAQPRADRDSGRTRRSSMFPHRPTCHPGRRPGVQHRRQMPSVPICFSG